MQTTSVFLIMFGAFWLAALIAFHPWVQRTRHPASKPLGAYLTFVVVFTVMSYGIFAAIVALQDNFWPGLLQAGILPAMIVIVVCFLPSFVAASVLIARRPSKAPPVDEI
jgi:hypothetical protein